ncbi:pentapeptide repeat-containing protein [Rhodococcus sp. KBS0724]|uniref:pentapeptide repeat-containing protein n=1 Tax=Rhodococcus sp. KBS0724 TaxID=1179674 RepID=UPI00110F0D40|nr:pentapeptide repeat-containing protein [Rhodococcus sp. KBS0724]TSD40199.1 pentapeptide repeat-containing protein [Rhodococcus sp. KBS0724]
MNEDEVASGQTPAIQWVWIAFAVIVTALITMGILALLAWTYEWEGFWKGAGQPFATVVAGMAALAAGALAFYNGERQRDAEAVRNKKDLQTRQDESDRQHSRETDRDLRSRFTTATGQLAHSSPTIRRSGVFAMASLANDWLALKNLGEGQACINVLTGYLAEPNSTYKEGDEDHLPHPGVDGPVRETIIRLLSDRRAREWMGLTYDLAHADLSAVPLVRPNLADADLSRAYLVESKAPGGNLMNANLQDAQMSGIDLSGSNLTDANLTSANLSRAKLVGADLTRARMGGIAYVHFLKSPDGSAHRTVSILNPTNLEGADLTGAILTEAALRGTRLTRVQMKDADLAGKDLTNTNLEHAWLPGANLTGAVLDFSKLSAIDLNEANLSGAKLGAAELIRASLKGAKLVGADCRYANLTGANLSGADLTGADFTGANLTDANLTEVTYSETRWPDGFQPFRS